MALGLFKIEWNGTRFCCLGFLKQNGMTPMEYISIHVIQYARVGSCFCSTIKYPNNRMVALFHSFSLIHRYPNIVAVKKGFYVLKTTRLYNVKLIVNDQLMGYMVGRVSDMGHCWQVMYDATGVRLQAGRQAEVCCLVLLVFFFSTWNTVCLFFTCAHIMPYAILSCQT